MISMTIVEIYSLIPQNAQSRDALHVNTDDDTTSQGGYYLASYINHKPQTIDFERA